MMQRGESEGGSAVGLTRYLGGLTCWTLSFSANVRSRSSQHKWAGAMLSSCSFGWEGLGAILTAEPRWQDD